MQNNKVEFVEPRDIAAGEEERDRLTNESADISLQLANRNKTHESGVRFTDNEYHAWRHKALTALNARQKVLRQLHAWLAKERQKQGLAPIDDTKPRQLLKKAYELLTTLVEDDVELDPAEQEFITELGDYLQQREAA